MRISKVAYSSFVYLFFYIPISIVVIFSFNKAKHSLIWHGFTTDWYKELFQDASIFNAALHSITIGVLAASTATIIGTIAAVNLFRYNFFGKKLLHGLLFVLVVLPEIVMGIALLILYTVLNVPLGFWSLLFAHITLCVPFIAVPVYSRIVTLNRNIIEAAKDLGANDFTIFMKVIIPLLFPAIISGWLLGFTLSLDDVIISYFVTGPDYEILPLKIYSMVRMGVKPEVNALCTILLMATLVIIVVSQLVIREKHD
jgi:spermidine/putrescine transport system permease protein